MMERMLKVESDFLDRLLENTKKEKVVWSRFTSVSDLSNKFPLLSEVYKTELPVETYLIVNKDNSVLLYLKDFFSDYTISIQDKLEVLRKTIVDLHELKKNSIYIFMEKYK